jgi:hypothetical protein
MVASTGALGVSGIANRDASSGADEDFFQHGARVTALANGFFVIAWVTQAYPQDGGSGLRARLFNRSGSPRGAPFFVASTRDGDQTSVELASSGEEWMAVWEDLDRGDIRARRFAAGGPIDLEEIIAVNAHSPAVAAMAGDGDFGIVWINSSFQAYAARSRAGLAHDPAARIMTMPDGRLELAPSAAAFGDALAVGLQYEGYEDGDLAIFDPLNLEPTPPQEAAVRALLRGISTQTQVGLIATPTGVWVTWTDDSMDFYDGSHQLAAYFIPAP